MFSKNRRDVQVNRSHIACDPPKQAYTTAHLLHRANQKLTHRNSPTKNKILDSGYRTSSESARNKYNFGYFLYSLTPEKRKYVRMLENSVND